MKKIKVKSVIWGLFFIIGLIILMESINLGKHEALIIERSAAGAMDANVVIVFLEQAIAKYRFIGSILSILGGIGVLISTNLSLNKNQPY